MRKRCLLLMMVFIFMFGSCLTVHAEAVDVIPFDAQYYAENNPDVVAALGNDPNVLYQHYMNNGKAEGRKPCANADVEAIAMLSPKLSLEQVKSYTADQVKQMNLKDYFYYIDSAYTYGIIGDAYIGNHFEKVDRRGYWGDLYVGGVNNFSQLYAFSPILLEDVIGGNRLQHYDFSSFDTFARDYRNNIAYEAFDRMLLREGILQNGKYFGEKYPRVEYMKTEPNRIGAYYASWVSDEFDQKEIYSLVDSCKPLLEKYYGVTISSREGNTYRGGGIVASDDDEGRYYTGCYVKVEYARIAPKRNAIVIAPPAN